MTERAFQDQAVDSAHAFRAIMKAMAHPGKCLAFAPDVGAPPPLSREAAAVALTLSDYQSPIWLSPGLDVEPVRRYLRFHTGAPLTTWPRDCVFAFLALGDEPPPLSHFAQGSHEYPDQSATLVCAVRELTETFDVSLSGPGIAAEQHFRAAGLPAQFWTSMIANNAGFPVGIDVIFVANGVIASCPRSTTIRMAESV